MLCRRDITKRPEFQMHGKFAVQPSIMPLPRCCKNREMTSEAPIEIRGTSRALSHVNPVDAERAWPQTAFAPGELYARHREGHRWSKG